MVSAHVGRRTTQSADAGTGPEDLVSLVFDDGIDIVGSRRLLAGSVVVTLTGGEAGGSRQSDDPVVARWIARAKRAGIQTCIGPYSPGKPQSSIKSTGQKDVAAIENTRLSTLERGHGRSIVDIPFMRGQRRQVVIERRGIVDLGA